MLSTASREAAPRSPGNTNMNCHHSKAVKHGFDRKGHQRYRCTLCLLTWSDKTGHYQNKGAGVYRLTAEQDAKIVELLNAGLSFREVRKRTGFATETIMKRKRLMEKPAPPRKEGAKPLYDCDYCGKLIDGEREMFRRTARTKHKFCSKRCYALHRRAVRENDQCPLCRRRRRDIAEAAVVFSKGHCQHCYNLLRVYGFDPEAVNIHELTSQLRKVVRRAEANRKYK